ncbi:histidine ammonia-lyase, partial [Rhizobium ruizarguesonis]
AIVERLRYLVAIELIASVQAVELRGFSGELGKGSAEAYAFVRTHVPALEEDRAQGPDFATIAALIGRGPQ